ncbi:MAG: NADP-dependent phosphogluconate dehydrogenase [Myxococcota bacterium]
MPSNSCDVAVIGLGVMGANLARNFASRGLRVALFDRSPEATQKLAAAEPEAAFVPCETLPQLVEALERPRRIILLVPAGQPVDDSLDALDPLLDADDVIIDSGNSLFTDTDRRSARADASPWRFVGMGISGGSEGALRGPAMMPGGTPEAWERLRPVLESIAAVSDSGPCVTYCGRGSAGHFVKMVHNGIEYGDMQLIAESAILLRQGLGLAPEQIADTFSTWNEAELESYLIDITANIFRKRDPEDPSALLLDAVLDRAGQKGTGRWTIKVALDLGVAVPTLAAAVDARVLSAQRERRVEAAKLFASSPPDANAAPRGAMAALTAEDVRAALYASKIASYSQGFDLLASASETFEYGTNLAEVARIWKAGCIIRAGFLDGVREAFSGSVLGSGGDSGDGDGSEASILALAPGFRNELASRVQSWRRVVIAASEAGIPVPGLATSLAWFDTLRTEHGSASLIQAQRDYFGSHTYERRDTPGKPVHSDWAKTEN